MTGLTRFMLSRKCRACGTLRCLVTVIMDGGGGGAKTVSDGGAGDVVNVGIKVFRCRNCHFGVSSPPSAPLTDGVGSVLDREVDELPDEACAAERDVISPCSGPAAYPTTRGLPGGSPR
jgi:hypothetical protein